MQNLIIVRPSYDFALEFVSYWLSQTIDNASKKFVVYDLEGEHAYPESIHNILEERKPVLTLMGGHGNPEIYSGTDKEYVIWTDPEPNPNINKVKGMVNFLLSCSTGAKLGPDIASQENTFFVGYLTDFIFAGFEPGDEYSYYFGKANIDIANALINGKTVAQAVDAGIKAFDEGINYWNKSESAIAPMINSYLLQNKESLVAYPGGPVQTPVLSETKLPLAPIILAAAVAGLSLLMLK